VAANLAVCRSDDLYVSNPVPVNYHSASAGTPIQYYTDVPSLAFAAAELLLLPIQYRLHTHSVVWSAFGFLVKLDVKL